MNDALEILEQKLLRQFISGFNLGDIWKIYIGGFVPYLPHRQARQKYKNELF